MLYKLQIMVDRQYIDIDQKFKRASKEDALKRMQQLANETPGQYRMVNKKGEELHCVIGYPQSSGRSRSSSRSNYNNRYIQQNEYYNRGRDGA